MTLARRQLATATLAVLAIVLTGAANPVYKDKAGILLLGDSMMKANVGPVLRRALEEKFGPPVVLHAKSSSGLSRPDFYDWPRAAREQLNQASYRSVVMFIGANDCQSIDEKKKVYRFGTTEWNEVYTERVKALAALLCDHGRKVYWLALPPMRDWGFSKRIGKLTALTKAALAPTCVKWVETESVLTDGGRFATQVKDGRKKVKVRDVDGIHLTSPAGSLLARVVGEAMAR